MKTLLKKMKSLTTCTILLISVLSNAQNDMTYVKTIYPNKTDTGYIDFTYLESSGLMTQARGDSVNKYMYDENIRDTAENKYVFRIFFNSWWGSAFTNSALGGAYDYVTYDSSQYGLWDLINSNLELDKFQAELRMTHEISYSNMALLVDTVCVGWSSLVGFVYGTLTGDYNQSTETAYLLHSSGKWAWVVDYYSVCKLTDELAERYGTLNQ